MQSLRAAYTHKSWIPFVTDFILVIVFAALGRAAHEGGLGPLEILGTAAPFLGALVLAWVIVLVTRLQPSKFWPAGVIVWVVTVTSGLALRILFGDTAALAFVLVATGVLAVFLLLPRLLLHQRDASESRD